MKKAILMFLAILLTAAMAACDSGNPDTTASSPPAAAQNPASPYESPEDNEARGDDFSENEARTILEAWLDEHPFQLGANLDSAQGTYTVDDAEYYRFTLDIIRFASAELLVDKITGEIFHYYTPGWHDVFEPIDNWYYTNHAGYLESDTTAPNDMGWPGWAGHYMNADGTKALRISDYNSRMEFFFELETEGRHLNGTAAVDADTALYMDMIFAISIQGGDVSVWIDEPQDGGHERELFIDTYFRSEDTIINEPNLF